MDKLSNDDLAYHRTVIAQNQAAQAISNSWVNHLTAKYKLTQGDNIGEDGSIIRQGQPPVVEGTPSAVG